MMEKEIPEQVLEMDTTAIRNALDERKVPFPRGNLLPELQALYTDVLDGTFLSSCVRIFQGYFTAKYDFA